MKAKKEITKENVLNKLLNSVLTNHMMWAYYVGTCCCFSPVSKEKMRGFLRATRKRVISEMRQAGIIPFEGPLKLPPKKYEVLGTVFLRDLRARKDLKKFIPRCRKKGISNKKSARRTMECLSWRMH
jgi:hypothetical protein